MNNSTMIDLLQQRAAEDANKLAFRFLENGEIDGPISEWRFAELYQQSLGVAEEIVEQGLVGKSVLLAFPPGLDFVKAFYGCLIAGARAVPVPLPNPRSKNPLARILTTAKACEAPTVMTTAKLAEMVSGMAPDLPVKLLAVSEKTAAQWSGALPQNNTVAYLQFTSGSTGFPKGVAVTHANVLANMQVMGELLQIKPDDPSMVWAPHYHDLCLVGHIIGPVYHGFESTLMSPMVFLMKPVRWLSAMSHYQVVNTACPNFGYDYAVRRIKDEECPGLDLSHWAVAGNGGEPVHKHTMDAFVEKFGRYGFRPETFLPCYGMAESVLFVAGVKSLSSRPKVLTLSASELEAHRVKIIDTIDFDADSIAERTQHAISCGRPGSGHRVIGVDPETFSPVGENQIGELWVEGPSVPSAYWCMPEESSATFDGRLAAGGEGSESNEGPFLRTGDLGFVYEGEVYVTGRLKDLIIIAGRNHYPSDIELSVQQSEAPIRAGSCVAVSETVNGNEELVIITEADERRIPQGTEAEKNEFWLIAAKTVQGAVTKGHGLSVRSVVFVAPRSLEKTSSGKPRRRFYKQQYQAGKLDVLSETYPPN